VVVARSASKSVHSSVLPEALGYSTCKTKQCMAQPSRSAQ
jgi:hypothetical protein